MFESLRGVSVRKSWARLGRAGALAGTLMLGASGAQAGLIALNWQFNDALTDASGTGNDGSYYDAAAGSPSYVPGVFGNALNLDSAQMVSRGDATTGSAAPTGLPVNAADAWTVNTWVNMTTLATSGHVVLGGFGSDPAGASLQGTKRFIRLRRDGTAPNYTHPLNFWGNSGTYDYTPGTDYNAYANAWHMVTATYSGTTLRMYVDGVQIGADHVRAYNATPGTGTLVARVGGEAVAAPVAANAFDGNVDDFSIWSVGLETGEVKALASTPTCGIAELAGYDAATMEKLIAAYRTGSGATAMVGGRAWQYVDGLAGHNAGDIWQVGDVYYMQFGGDSTSGMGVVAVPEPATMALLAAALLLPAVRRRRKV